MQIKMLMRASKSQHKYHQDPATVYSQVNHRLQNISPRLASSLAVNAVVRAIRKRQIVHRLFLGASSLGDAGCTRLFAFLASPPGLYCREGLTELFLTKNEIGTQGLLAVIAFLKGNMVLRELCLSGNPLTTDPRIVAELAHAVNSSHLCTLQILHSSSLGDSFAQVFLSRLSSPYLRELDLSAINMTQSSVPTLVDYVRSSRCRLHRLQCNANSLTLGGARKIISAIEENYSLRNVKLDDLHIHDHTAVITVEERVIEWRGCSRALSAILRRNSVLMAQVKDESLALLRYSRALFLRSESGVVKNGTHVLSPPRRTGSSLLFGGPSPFFSLPTELQEEIVSYLAPSLSYRQRQRIVCFAADTATLFQPHRAAYSWMQHADTIARLPQQGQPFEGSWRPPTWWRCRCPVYFQPTCPCLRRWRKEMRDIWLTQVACNTYERIL